MPQGRRTHEELSAMSERLLHDVQVAFHVSRTLVRSSVGFAKPSTWEVEMALVESFALHARALVDFFFTRKRQERYPEDAYAIDFFDPPTRWHRLMPEQGPWLSGIRLRAPKGGQAVDRFGQQLGHLNYVVAPLSDYARGWPTVQISRDLGAVLQVFVNHVDPRNVAPDFKSKAQREVPVAARLGNERQVLALWTPPATTRPLHTDA
jgi:hypothetical protein